MVNHKISPILKYSSCSIFGKKNRTWFVLLFVFFGMVISGTQVFGESPDYDQYADFFNLARREGLDTLSMSRFEVGFSVISLFLASLISKNIILYTWFVSLSMFLKGWVVNAKSSSAYIFLVVAGFYLVRYFPLHELTQLRVAIAIAIIMAGALLLMNGKLYQGLLICCTAVFFQMSAIALIPALLLPTKKRWQVVIISIIAFIFINITAGLVTENLSNHIQIINSYKDNGFHETKPNPFAIQLLIDWGVIIGALLIWRKLTLLMRRIILMELIGMAFFYGAIDLGVIAHRIREFYSVFWIFFIADGLRSKSTKLLCYLFVCACIFFYGYIFFISGKFFH